MLKQRVCDLRSSDPRSRLKVKCVLLPFIRVWMKEHSQYYHILGLDVDASIDDINQAYRD